MSINLRRLVLLLALVSAPVFADEDQKMGTIHKIDLADEGPKAPGYILTVFDVKKARVPGSRAHAIMRQMRKRTRAEFEGNGLPRGQYKLAFADNCSGADKNFRDLMEIKIVSDHVAVEKSHADIDLRPGGKNKIVLEGKSLALFQKQKNGKLLRIDCKLLN